MEKSMYYEIIERYLPNLILSIVETLNEKHTNTLSYLFKERLTPAYSADGRWSSIKGAYTRVAADVVSMDSELPLKSRDSLETASGQIPKQGMKLWLGETELKKIDGMIRDGRPIAQIVSTIFQDLPRVIEGIWERNEDIFLSMLSTGVGLATRSNGTGLRVDVGYMEENKFGASVLWDNATTSMPIDDIQRVFDKSVADQNVITDIWMDDAALLNFYKSQQVREQYAFGLNFVGSKIPTLGFSQAEETISKKWAGVTLHRVARQIKTELNGKKQNHTPWQSGMVVFTCNDILGDLVWTDCVEASRPVAGVVYTTVGNSAATMLNGQNVPGVDEYILTSQYRENDPFKEITSSQAMVIPIINNVDQIYTLDSKTVQA